MNSGKAPRGISESQVRSAIERLRARGMTVTVRNVHEVLGRGSYGTIQRVLKVIRTEALDEAREAPMHPATSPLADVAPELERLSLALSRMESTFSEELDKLYARFDSVQRIMLMEVDRARERSRQAQESVGQAGDKARVVEQALRGRITQLERKLMEANERLAALAPEPEDVFESDAPHEFSFQGDDEQTPNAGLFSDEEQDLTANLMRRRLAPGT